MGDEDIDALEAWTLETGSPGVIVAVLDSGADLDHPDLVNKLVPGQNFYLLDGQDPDDPSDNTLLSHGTFVAGIVGAEANNAEGIAGVSWGSMIMPLRVGPLGPDVCAAGNALVYAAQQPGVRIANMSFGDTDPDWPKILGPCVATAYQLGLVLVSTTGNTFGADGEVEYPASDPLVIAVGSTNPRDGHSCFSTAGPEISVTAPGHHMVSTWNPETTVENWCAGQPYCRDSGTSFSAAQVSGLAALILSVNPGFTNDEVRQIIESTAEDLGAAGFDVEFGHGRINAYVAVCTARGMTCMGDIDDDCTVGILDLLAVLAGWGSGAGPPDLDCDSVVGILDLLAVLANWGPCPPSGSCPSGGVAGASFEEELANAGLTMDDWDAFVECMNTGTQAEQDNCLCWMQYYLNGCGAGPRQACPDHDPFTDCVGDLNGDCCVDKLDADILLNNMGPCPAGPGACLGDLNGDCVVDRFDHRDLLTHFGGCPSTQVCPSPPPGCGPVITAGLEAAVTQMGFSGVGDYQGHISATSEDEAFVCACVLQAVLATQP